MQHSKIARYGIHKISFKNQSGRQNRTSPLYIRVIKDRKTKFITTGVKLKPTEWDEDKQRVKKNYSNSARMNAFLSQKVANIRSIGSGSGKKTQNGISPKTQRSH